MNNGKKFQEIISDDTLIKAAVGHSSYKLLVSLNNVGEHDIATAAVLVMRRVDSIVLSSSQRLPRRLIPYARGQLSVLTHEFQINLLLAKRGGRIPSTTPPACVAFLFLRLRCPDFPDVHHFHVFPDFLVFPDLTVFPGLPH